MTVVPITTSRDTQLQPQSPPWWRDRLFKQIMAFIPEADFYSDYYNGDHPLPWLAPQARDEFKRIIQMTRSNYMGLVCDAQVERIHVEGFRIGGEQKADKDSWAIWQSSNMDNDSDIAWLEAAIASRSYIMVEPNPERPDRPRMSVEVGTQAITESFPGNRRKLAAGMKVFTDDWTGNLNATLYQMIEGSLYVFKYEAEMSSNEALNSSSKPQWKPRLVGGEEWGGRVDGMDRIPLHPVLNNPRATGGRSELYDLTDIQDRINKTLADRLIASDYGSFPQKWATGWPTEDDEGNEMQAPTGRNRMLTTDIAETKFGQFQAEDLDQYNKAKHEDVKDVASRSRTPAQYLLGEMANVNGETLKASESGLIAKVKQRMRGYSEAAEEAMKTARTLAGIGTEADDQMEAIFANPEFRTEGELTDAVIKRFQSGISSLRQSRVDVGYSQAQIEDLEKDDARESVSAEVRAAVQGLVRGGGQTPNGVTGGNSDTTVTR